MLQDNERVRVEQVDWKAVFPFIRLFDAFWMAIWPPHKLLLALLMIALLYIGGNIFSYMAGPQVWPGELDEYARSIDDPEEFDRYLADRRNRQDGDLMRFVRSMGLNEITLDQESPFEEKLSLVRDATIEWFDSRIDKPRKVLEDKDSDEKARENAELLKKDLEDEKEHRLAELNEIASSRQYIFDAVLDYKLERFDRLIDAAVSLNFGFSSIHSEYGDSKSVIGVLRELGSVLPSWMRTRHPIFLGVWVVFALAVVAFFGGAISRLAALQAATGDTGGAGKALAFASDNWRQLLLAPFLPIIFVVVFGALMMLLGLLFNVPVLNIVGGLIYGLFLLLGFLTTMAMIFLILGFGLFYPAIAVEGVDAVEALSRCGHYLFGRFWHWLFYTVVALVFGAVTYIIIATVLFVTLDVTHDFTGATVMVEVGDHPDTMDNAFDVMVPQREFQQFRTEVDTSDLRIDQTATSMLINSVWIKILLGLMAAYAFSYYFSVQTWIYLLLRKSADLTDYDDVYRSPADAAGASGGKVPEKVEPSTPN